MFDIANSFEALNKATKPILTCGIQSSVRLKENLGGDATLVLITVPDEVREERAIARGSFDKVEWDNRMEQDTNFRQRTNVDTLADIVVENTTSIDEVVSSRLTKLNKGN